jgi:hypothetical protein
VTPHVKFMTMKKDTKSSWLHRLVGHLADKGMVHIDKLPDDAEVFVQASVWGKLKICFRFLRALQYVGACIVICTARPSLWPLVR